MKTDEWVVYIIQSESRKLYTGITTNLERRFDEHQKGQKKGARFFHFSKAKKIVFCERHPNRSEASKRESAIKKMNRTDKIYLIESSRPEKKSSPSSSDSKENSGVKDGAD